MSKQVLAWVYADKQQVAYPVSDYLESYLLPALSRKVGVARFGIEDFSSSALQEGVAFYQLESGACWQQIVSLAEEIPGIIYLHDLYHLGENLELQTLPAEVARRNVIILSNPRYVVEFAKAYPDAEGYCLALPATFLAPRKENEILSICSMASLNAEDAMHRLLRSLQKIEEAFVLRWLIDEDEIESAEMLLSQYGVSARLYVGRSVKRWQEICAASNYAVFLTSSVIRSCEPYPLISIAAGCSTVLSSRIYRDCYPSDAAVFVSLGLGLEHELANLFSKYPQGCINQEAMRCFIREQRNAEFVAQELAEIVNNIICKDTRYVSTI